MKRGVGPWHELGLALLPTVLVLATLYFIENSSGQRLLFASLASSAFAIYLDPGHRFNGIRNLLLAQISAAAIGHAAFAALGPGYGAAAGAMVGTIILMVTLDAVHPPAVSTALAFAFRSGPDQNLVLFGGATLLIVMLLLLQRASVWLMERGKR